VRRNTGRNSLAPLSAWPDFQSPGLGEQPLYPLSGQGDLYVARYGAREAERLGLSFMRPEIFPQNGLHAARIACAAQGATWLPDFVRAVYAANFAQGRDISDLGTLAQILNSLGQDPDLLFLQAQSPEVKSQLRANTDTAMAKGVFGAPSFLVKDTLFWGNDRLEAAIDCALRT
jgi:2-hydroxychromene-2-carboxylate isomerase